MKKLLPIIGLVALLAIPVCYAQFKMFPKKNSDPNKKRYVQPALPYGPKDQQPWYKSRSFETTDFQESSEFELRREETEKMRRLTTSKLYAEEIDSN